MPEKPSKIPEIARYRSGLAQILLEMNSSSPATARGHLQTLRSSPSYKIARSLDRDPTQLAADRGLARVEQLRGGEEESSNYYISNEYYARLALRLQNLGGVGLVVGTDQPLDFFTMANLSQVYAVDIDPHVSLITRAYVETGSRFHQILDRYPTTDEYVSLFNDDNRNVLLGLLAARTAGHNFSQGDIDWLGDRYEETNFGDYLSQKKRFYHNASWISSDQNLANVIQAYEQGRVKIGTGDISGNLLPIIGEKVENDGEQVSLIYTSNAPLYKDASLAAFKKLPITDDTLVIFSSLKDSMRKQIPSGYTFARGWNHYLFSPHENKYWPHPYQSMNEPRYEAYGISYIYLSPFL